uniref:Uncharacterized protein n=1 Tax=Anguilla anguilla TaxID=7936 RepID=A0A0E9X4F8_ANGAN
MADHFLYTQECQPLTYLVHWCQPSETLERSVCSESSKEETANYQLNQPSHCSSVPFLKFICKTTSAVICGLSCNRMTMAFECAVLQASSAEGKSVPGNPHFIF